MKFYKIIIILKNKKNPQALIRKFDTSKSWQGLDSSLQKSLTRIHIYICNKKICLTLRVIAGGYLCTIYPSAKYTNIITVKINVWISLIPCTAHLGMTSAEIISICSTMSSFDIYWGVHNKKPSGGIQCGYSIYACLEAPENEKWGGKPLSSASVC